MIRPSHQCYWSHIRTTSVSIGDRKFIASGTSLPVVFDAFRGDSLRWYSVAYGEEYGGVKENLCLIAVSANTPHRPEEQPYAGKGPLREALPPDLGEGIEESRLTSELCRVLQIREEPNDYLPQDWEQVRYALYLHDDCFAVVEGVDRERLTRLVHGTLKLHSFYLSQEVEWGPVLAETTALLEEAGDDCALVSDPQNRTLTISRGEPASGRSGHRKVPVARLHVEGGVAEFQRLAPT